jgi:gliding motility-associated-like protein
MKNFLFNSALVLGILMNVSFKTTTNAKFESGINSDSYLFHNPIAKLKTFPFLDIISLGSTTVKQSNMPQFGPCPDNAANPHPEHVRWPAGAVQNLGTFACGNGPTVTVEVLKTGVTGPAGNPASVSCIVWLGLNSWGCAPPQVITMSPNGFNGSYSIFTATLNNLPPGTHSLTCACTTNPAFIPFDDPTATDYAYGNWIGDYHPVDCPALASPFTDHNVTITPTAPNDVCTGTPVNLTTGANSVNNNCSADGLVWFTYTVMNGNIVSLTANAGTVTNPIINQIRVGSCTGTTVTSPVNCLAPGTILYIEAGKVQGACPELGTFTINVSDLSGPPNDVCSGATASNNFGGNNVLDCGETGNFNGNTSACPDAQATCFGASTNGVWYSFTAGAALSTFSVTASGSGTYELFTGTCASLTSLGCNVTNLTANPALTYYLLVGPNGSVTVTAASAPANDVCASATTVTTGTNNGLTNICASQDLTPCPGNANQASVWFVYNLTADQDIVTFSSSLANSVVRVYNACGGALVTDTDGVDCNATATITCRPTGNHYIFVSSPTADAGNFSLTITASSNGVANDECADATNITAPADCAYHPVNTTTTNACPETFSLSCNGGNNNADPTVWLRFTVPTGVNSINIRNITPAGAYLSIFPACGTGTAIAGGNCLSGAGPTPNIAVTAGTTYYIAAARAGSSGTIDFELKYNIFIANDNPCVPGTFTVVALSDNVPSSPQNNVCATPDDQMCGDPGITNTLWYSITVAAPNENLLVSFSNTSGGFLAPAVAIYNNTTNQPCSGNPLQIECATPFLFECLPPGNYLIQIGTTASNAGTFTITADVQDNGVSNETCSEGTVIPSSPTCEFITAPTTTTVNACPEGFTVPGCALNYSTAPIVWYSFTTPAGTTSIEIENITPNAFLTVFQSCPNPTAPVLTGASCLSGNGTNGTPITANANTTYYVAIGINGPAGDVTFNIKYNVPPANDVCTSPVAVSAGANANLTNVCATQDATPCTAPTNQASVWYSYTIPAGVKTLTITSSLPNSVVNVYQPGSNCNSLTLLTPAANCDNEVELDCPAPQNILIFVSSSTANAGTFTLTLNQQNTTAANDLCTNATVINTGAPCVFVPVTTTTTVGACPEGFTVSGCALNYSTAPIVWYQFTTPANTQSIEIQSIANNAFLTIFTACPSPTAPILPGGGCLSGNGTNGTPIPVTPNTTYYIAIGINGTPGNVAFSIKFNIPPVNDICTAPITVNQGNNANLTNFCATQDATPCPAPANQASVWYSYTIPPAVRTLTITSTLNGGIVNVFQNTTNCNSLTLLTAAANCDNEVVLDCPDPQVILIMVSSSTTNAGTFALNINQENVTAANDLCTNPETIAQTPTCEFFPVTGTTTVGACPEKFTVTGCALNYSTSPVVWYSFTPPTGTISIEVNNITANAFLTIFQSCPSPTAPILPGGGCLSGNGTNGNPIPVTAGNTYYIAIGINGPAGNIDFNIKYNLELPNDNPCSTSLPFTATVLNNGTPATGQNNTCATADDNMCSNTNINKTMWYAFTISAPNNKITINITGTGVDPIANPAISIFDNIGAGTPNVPCTNNPINSDCDGNSTAEFNCLAPGTYLIQIGSTNANAGEFSITATAGVNDGPPNDLCTGATPINIGPNDLCVNLPQTGSNINACPENLPSGSIVGNCNFNIEETSWYVFTAPGTAGQMPTMDFIFTAYSGTGTPFMNLFNFGTDCTTLTLVGTQCYQGLNTAFNNIGPLTPGQQYLIAVSSSGDTGGNFNFNVKFNLGPANDNPCAPAVTTTFNLGNGGQMEGTTNCAGADPFFPTCPQANQQNVVFFTYTVGPNDRGVNILIRTVPGQSQPIPAGSPVVVGILPNACTGNTFEEAACITIDGNHDFLCLEPGQYYIQVSTSSADQGDFNIVATPLTYTTSCQNTLNNDDCDQALDITSQFATVDCLPRLIQGCNQQACPENFTYGASCPFNTMPVVWYKVTTGPDVVAMDITGVSSTPAGAFLAVFENITNCNATPTAVSNCITNQQMGIGVSPNTTYYIAVGINSATMAGGNFQFNLTMIAPPINDDPVTSSPRPPYDLSGGGSHAGTTCCAFGANDNNMDLPNVQCGNITQDNAVWYRYTFGSEEAIEISVTAGTISGNTTVEVVRGTAAGAGNQLYNNTTFRCGALPATIRLSCFEPGEIIYIKVASADRPGFRNCGTFNISVNPIMRCPMADNCEDISAAQILETAPTDVTCGNFVVRSIAGCLELACPETSPTDCGIGNNPTVWFQIQTDEEAVQLVTSITAAGSWTPEWAVYYGDDCGNLTLLPGGDTTPPSQGVPCGMPPNHAMGIPYGPDGITPVTTFYVAVTTSDPIDNPNFTLFAFTKAGCVSCIGNQDCSLPGNSTLLVTERSSGRPLNDPLFCTGEEVRVCFTFFYDASATGVDWFHGLIPDFGPGWDMRDFNPDDVTVSPGGVEWNDENDGDCAPRINEFMPLLCTYTGPDGRLRICNIQCGDCPCVGNQPLTPNSPLPSGWFWSRNGGAGCLNNCSPATRYGIGSVTVTVNICMNLKVKEFPTQAECNANKSLRLRFVTTSDGVSGCWNDPVAECKLDIAVVGPNWEIDCNTPPAVNATPNPQELCYTGTTNITLTQADGQNNGTIIVTAIPNPNISGAANATFFNGFGVLQQTLTNLTSSVQIQRYEAYTVVPGLLCPGPKTIFEVIMYPNLLVNFPPTYICDGGTATLTPNVVGGTGNYIGTSSPFVPAYQWSNGATTQTISVSPPVSTTYCVTVTDDLGCSGTACVFVEVKLPVTFDIDPTPLIFCKDGQDDNTTVSVTNVFSNFSNYSVSWNSTPSGLDIVNVGQSVFIRDETSNPFLGPYNLCATVTDAFGCFATNCETVEILEGPNAVLQVVGNIPCGATTVNLSINTVLLPGQNAIFRLLDCDENQLFDQFTNPYIAYNQFEQFNGVPLGGGCFKLATELVDGTGQTLGCTNITTLNIPIPQGTPATLTPNTAICAGESTNIAVTNASAYTSFNWSPAQGNVSSFTVSPTSTTQFTVTATQSNGCTSVRSVTITVNPLPTPGITGSTTFCPGDNTTLTASGGATYVWSGPAGFTANTASTGAISESGTYTVTVTNAQGCTATASQSIMESDQLTVVVPNLVLCDNNPDTLDAGDGFTSYEWRDPMDNIIGTTQKVEVSQPGTYSLVVMEGTCSGSTTVEVSNTNTPVLNLPDTIQVCRIANGTGQFPTFINFDALTGGITGTWFNTDLAPVDVSDWSNVSFTTVPQRDTFNFTFVTNTAMAPCMDVSGVVTVVARNCACPAPNITFPNLCNSRTNPLLLNNNWVGTPPPGIWSVVGGPTPYPTITNNNELSVLGVQEGTYRLRYTYDPPVGGACATFIERDLLVFAAPTITVQNAVLCNKTTGTDPTTLNLNSLITSLSEPSQGTWTQLSGAVPSGTLPNINVLNMTPQTLVFEYTTTAVTPCTPVKAQVEVRIRDCDCIDVTILPDTLCNGSMTLLDLQQPGRFTTNPPGATGTWSIAPPNSIVNGQFFNPFGVVAGAYTATFTLSGTQGPGCQTTFNKSLVIRNQPVATVRTDTTACSVATGNGPTSINLFTLLNTGYSTGGTWSQVSPATPTLTIPANAVVDFAGQTIGTQFVFRYSIGAQAPCSPVQADVRVTVRDCNCPDASIGVPPDLCNDSGILNLNTLLGPTTAPGDWSVTGPGGNVPLTGGSILSAGGLQAGNYTITYTLNPVPGGSCTKFSTRTLNIRNLVTAVVNPDTVVCNTTSANGTPFLNLNLLVKNGAFGVWKDQNGNDILSPGNVDFSMHPVGTVLVYTFNVTNTPPCMNQSYPVNITVIDCACEQIVLGSIPPTCTSAGTLDLKAFSDPKPGTWSATNPALVITNGVLNLTGVPAGMYELRYTLTNPQPGCPASRTLMITLFNPRNAGTPTTAQFCADASEVVVLANLLAGEDTGGTWTSTSGNVGPEFNAAAGTFNITGKAPGTYTFRYAFSNQAPCPDVNSTVTVVINPLPIADVGANPRNINCTVQTTVLGGNNTSSGPTITYQWSLGGNVVGTTREFTANQGGLYTLRVLNTETGCSDTKTVQVIQADDLPVFDIRVDSIKCFGQRATITVLNIRGGVAPYQISFNNGTNYGSATVAGNLAPGTYKVLVRDANGCVNDQMPAVVITEPPLLTVELGNDITLTLGEDTTIVANIPGNPANISTIRWKRDGNDVADWNDLTSVNVQPEQNTEISVTVTDRNGCVASDNIRIFIRSLNPECIPNIFTPNTRPDGNNDYFSINCKDVDEVTKYRIYDRWGNLIFISDNIKNTGTTIDQTRFWDGKFKGNFVVPGVYVYYIELKFKNGDIEKRAGDVTVLR